MHTPLLKSTTLMPLASPSKQPRSKSTHSGGTRSETCIAKEFRRCNEGRTLSCDTRLSNTPRPGSENRLRSRALSESAVGVPASGCGLRNSENRSAILLLWSVLLTHSLISPRVAGCSISCIPLPSSNPRDSISLSTWISATCFPALVSSRLVELVVVTAEPQRLERRRRSSGTRSDESGVHKLATESDFWPSCCFSSSSESERISAGDHNNDRLSRRLPLSQTLNSSQRLKLQHR